MSELKPQLPVSNQMPQVIQPIVNPNVIEPQPNMGKKKFPILAIILIILSLLLISGGVVYYITQKDIPIEPPKSENIETSEMQTYQGDTFTFQIPNNWVIDTYSKINTSDREEVTFILPSSNQPGADLYYLTVASGSILGVGPELENTPGKDATLANLPAYQGEASGTGEAGSIYVIQTITKNQIGRMYSVSMYGNDRLVNEQKQMADYQKVVQSLKVKENSQGVNKDWKTYTNTLVVDYQKSYTLTYPPSWELKSNTTPDGITSITLTKGLNMISITQGPMGAGGCLYPKDPDEDGMVSRYGQYQEFNKGDYLWRAAKLEGTDYQVQVVCEKMGNGRFAGMTNIGYIELKMDSVDQAIIAEFYQILDKLELINSDVQSSKARVNGKVCYPSEFIPEGIISAKNISTNKITKKDNPVNSGKFALDLDPGIYVFAYLPVKASGFDGVTYDGFYTKCATTMMNTDCDDKSEHQLIKVTLEAGQVNDEVSLCDWYHNEEMTPEF